MWNWKKARRRRTGPNVPSPRGWKPTPETTPATSNRWRTSCRTNSRAKAASNGRANPATASSPNAPSPPRRSRTLSGESKAATSWPATASLFWGIVALARTGGHRREQTAVFRHEPRSIGGYRNRRRRAAVDAPFLPRHFSQRRNDGLLQAIEKARSGPEHHPEFRRPNVRRQTEAERH